MNDLTDLERTLGPDLERALNAVMPGLEDPSIAAADHDRGHFVTLDRSVDPIRIAPVESPKRPRWHVVSAAAAVGLLIGGLAVIGAHSSEQRPTPHASTPTLLDPADSVATTQAQSVSVGDSFPLDGLDPYDAAAIIFLDARIGPTPDEQADLEAAGEILRRECLRDGGATPPSVTAAEHRVFRDDLDSSYTLQMNPYTTAGLEFRREHGFLRNAAAIDADTPLHLKIEEGSSEEQLMLGGCGVADAALRSGPAEQALRASTFESADSRWYSLGPAELPEFADGYQFYDDCMTAAGYPNHDEVNVDDNPFSDFFLDPEYSIEERAAVNADADCRISTDLPTVYIEALLPVLVEYDDRYEPEIAAIDAERDLALASARVTLIENGIEPFTR